MGSYCRVVRAGLVGAAMLAACAGDAQPGARLPGGPAAGAAGDGSDVGDLHNADPGAAIQGPQEPNHDVIGVEDGQECNGIVQRAESKLAPVDIIWAVDTSGSMFDEALGVQQHMNEFAKKITEAGLDVHVVMLSDPGPPGVLYPPPIGPGSGVCIPAPLGSGTCPQDSNEPGYLHVLEGVSSTNGLTQIQFLYPTYKHVLRPNALKYFAVVSDDTDSSADGFIHAVQALDPGPPNMFQEWKFFGVFCTGSCPTSGGAPLSLAPCVEIGEPYLELVERTGGVSGDLCAAQSDFAGVFDGLAQSVIETTQLACDWEIPPPPDGEIFDPRKVNVDYTPGDGSGPQHLGHVKDPGTCAGTGGWYYDNPDAPTKVVACPATCDALKHDQSGQVDVVFGCATVEVPD